MGAIDDLVFITFQRENTVTDSLTPSDIDRIWGRIEKQVDLSKVKDSEDLHEEVQKLARTRRWDRELNDFIFLERAAPVLMARDPVRQALGNAALERHSVIVVKSARFVYQAIFNKVSGSYLVRRDAMTGRFVSTEGGQRRIAKLARGIIEKQREEGTK